MSTEELIVQIRSLNGFNGVTYWRAQSTNELISATRKKHTDEPKQRRKMYADLMMILH